MLVGLGLAVALGASAAIGAAPAYASEGKSEQAESKKYGIGQVVAEKLLAAYDLLESEKYAEALEIVDALAERRRLKPPELAQIHRFRAYIFVSQDQNEKATGEFEKSLALHAMDPAAEQVMMYSLAQIYTELERYDEALALMDRWFGAEQSPKADAYFLKAMILTQQQDYAAAAEPIARAIELSEKPKESWLTLYGVVFTSLKDFPKVEQALERLVEIAPAKSQYWMQLAAVQHHLGHDKQALATLQLAYQAGLLKGDKELRQLASMLFLRQQPFECAQVIEGAIASGTIEANAEAYRLMANCLIAARETEKAFGPLAKGAELAADGDMHLLLGQMHLQRDEFEPAIAALEQAARKARPEQRGSVHLLIGIAQLGSERFDEAERSFELAADDSKVNRAAESYLKFLHEKQATREPVRMSGSATGG